MNMNPRVSRYTLPARKALRTTAAIAEAVSRSSRAIRKSMTDTSATYIWIERRRVRVLAPKIERKIFCSKKKGDGNWPCHSYHSGTGAKKLVFTKSWCKEK